MEDSASLNLQTNQDKTTVEFDRLENALGEMRRELNKSQDTQVLLQSQVKEAAIELRKQAEWNQSEMLAWKKRYEDLEKTTKSESEQILELKKTVEEQAQTILSYKRKLDEAEAKNQVEKLEQETAMWQIRYLELLEEDSGDYDALIVDLRQTIDECIQKMIAYEEEMEKQKAAMLEDETIEENRDLEQENGDLKSLVAELRSMLEAREKSFEQLRRVALKRKWEADQNERNLKSEINHLKANRMQVWKERNDSNEQKHSM